MRQAAMSRLWCRQSATVAVCIGLLCLVRLSAGVGAQESPTDADLEVASAGRSARIGVTASGGPKPTKIPLEVYVARVLAGEGEPRAAEGAHRALAIAIRTYVVANEGRHHREGFDLCDTTHCQVMRSATPVSRAAALSTAGTVLMYAGGPAEVFYSASCGGRSETAVAVWPGLPDFPYLRPVDDNVHGNDSSWTLDMSSTDIRKALGRAGFTGRRLTGISIDQRNDSGRVSRLSLKGLRPTAVSGAEFRMAVGPTALRSTAFTVERAGRGYRFTGKGYGHGVGMCVIGAGRLARAGASAEKILGHYYPGLSLGSYDGTPAGPVSRTAPPAATLPAPRGISPISLMVAEGSGIDRADLEGLAGTAFADLSRILGVSVAPVALQMHGTVESFRRQTGKPWWVSSAVSGAVIHLSPATLLAQREGVEATLRMAMAELLIGRAFGARPAWVRVGAARYFGRGASAGRPAQPGVLECPADTELLTALSASTQRDADARAERCFARALVDAKDWRDVR